MRWMHHDDKNRIMDYDETDSKKLNKNDLRFGHFRN